MRIGEFASAAKVDVETVRFYEREGLLPPPKRLENGYRTYDASHLRRLTFIRHCRSLDIGLDDVSVLLNTLDAPGSRCEKVDTVIDAQLARVRSRIQSLRVLERELRALRSRCDTPSAASACGILEGLVCGEGAVTSNVQHGRG